MITFILCAHSRFLFHLHEICVKYIKKRLEMLVISNNLLPLPLN